MSASDIQTGDAVRAAAAQAAALGYQVLALHGVDADGVCTCRKGLACPSPGKHPKGRNWQREPGSLSRFRHHTDGRAAFNLGLRLDADARVPLVLIDVDTKHGKPGAASLAQLVAEYGPLPSGALLQTTPTGGSHYLLRLPEGIDPRELATGTDLLPGLDVFTHQRQFVVSPSRTAAGSYALADAARGLPGPSTLPVLPEGWLHWLQQRAPTKGAVAVATEDLLDAAPRPELVVQLLELLPAPADNTRDDCVNFAIACHGALANAEPGELTAAEGAFLQWAGRWPGADPEHDQYVWATTKEAKHRGWRHVLIDAQRFLERARAATNAEDAGVTDGADIDLAQALLDDIRQDEAQRAFLVDGVQQPSTQLLTRANQHVFVQSFADVRPTPIEWLLEGRLARQHITMINGWPGEGKTSVVIDIVARMTRGESLPDGTVPPRPLRVLYLSTEDSASVLHLRLRAAGADMTRAFTISDDQLASLTLPSGKDAWVQFLKAHDIDVVVVDPMKSFLDDGLKDIAEQDARKFMQALKQIVEATDVAAICIRHPNKATAAGHSTAISAASGSLGFTAAARMELLVGRMPDEEETRALVHVKNNLAKPPTALLYRIVSKDVPFDDEEFKGITEKVAGIEWKGTNDEVLADDLLARRESREQRTKIEEAKEFLMNILVSGPAERNTVLKKAKQQGIALRTLERARQGIGWTAIDGNLRTGGKAIWGLNGQAPSDFVERTTAARVDASAGRVNGDMVPVGNRESEQASLEEPLRPVDLSDLEGKAA